MKRLHELIVQDDPAWPLVQQWVERATNHVEVLPPIDNATRERALVETQVTTRSPMGAVIFETGGILVDRGWLRVLGSWHPRLPRSLPEWNRGRVIAHSGQPPPFLLIADDVIGGFFAIDGGGLELDKGKVCYFAPNTLAWESTRLGYSEFLVWSLQGNLAKYYEDTRWPGWEEEVARIGGSQSLSIIPFLSCDGPPIAERSRQPISVDEIYDLTVGKDS
jgi:hypothetical protein